ncbi:hypothetical protein MRX96_000157 [Rhipicephalus microplus]
MVTGSFSLAAVLDPHRPSRKILHLPEGFGVVAVNEDLDAARGLWSHAGAEVSAALGGPGRIGDERSFGVDYLAPAYAGGH